MTCPTCGRRMTLVRPKNRTPYYACGPCKRGPGITLAPRTPFAYVDPLARLVDYKHKGG